MNKDVSFIKFSLRNLRNNRTFLTNDFQPSFIAYMRGCFYAVIYRGNFADICYKVCIALTLFMAALMDCLIR